MRFDTWLEKWEALRDELAILRDGGLREVPQEWEEREYAHQQIVKRTYRINSRLAINIYYQRPIGQRAAVFHPSLEQSYKNDRWIDTNPMLHHFTVEELKHISDMLNTSDRWEAGLIDEMPPSGPWPHEEQHASGCHTNFRYPGHVCHFGCMDGCPTGPCTCGLWDRQRAKL